MLLPVNITHAHKPVRAEGHLSLSEEPDLHSCILITNMLQHNSIDILSRLTPLLSNRLLHLYSVSLSCYCCFQMLLILFFLPMLHN